MNRLKFLRKERGLTLKRLQEITNISYSYISLFEDGSKNPCIKDLFTLASYFEVSIDYMLNKSNYSILARDENSNIIFRMNEVLYTNLVNGGFIYFKNDHRCFRLNDYFCVNDNIIIGKIIVGLFDENHFVDYYNYFDKEGKFYSFIVYDFNNKTISDINRIIKGA